MRTTLLWQAKAQYQWHRHVPLIRFTGSRKALWETKPAQTLLLLLETRQPWKQSTFGSCRRAIGRCPSPKPRSRPSNRV
ncbi:hypothetical protein IW139_005807, partial [Coemansia sp. RSA 353]